MTDAEGTIKSLEITDESVKDLVRSMADSKTAYSTADDAMKAYQLQLQTTGKTLDLTNLKTKALSASMKILSSIGWMVAITLITEGISALVNAIDEWHVTLEEAKEKTEEEIAELESLTSEVETLESKLSDLNQQISKLDPITDAQDIENLKLETAELEAQLAILKEKERIAKSETNEAAKDSLTTKTGSKYKGNIVTSTHYVAGEVATITTRNPLMVTEYQELQYAMDAYGEYSQKVLALQEELNRLTEGTSEHSAKAKEIQEWSNKMKDARTHANALAESVESQSKGLVENDDETKKLKDTITSILNRYVDFTNVINTTTDALEEQDDAQTVLKSFTEAFNAESFKDSAEALKELAISGELSPETFTTTKAYITLLEQTGLTAEEAIEKIRGIAVAESSLSDVMGSMSSLAKLMNEVTSEIADSGQISFDTLQSIASKYPSLERYVTDYLNGVEGAEANLISALDKMYAQDLDNYKEYYQLKQGNDTTWYNNYITTNDNWVKELKDNYGLDLKNYHTYLEAKSAIETKIRDVDNRISAREKILDNAPLWYQNQDKEMLDLLAERATLSEQLTQMIETYNKDVQQNVNVDTLLDGLLKDYVGGSSSSSSDAHKEEFDRKLAELKHRHEMNLISDAEYYNELDRLNQKYFANRTKYLDEYRKYEEEVYKGLLSVQEDAISSINKLIDLRIDMIKDEKEAEIDALKETIDAEKEKLDFIKEQIDARKEALELLKEETDHETELTEKNSAISKIQAKLDEIRYDNSASAQKKRRELEEELTEAQKDLADYISDYEYDKAIEALDKEAEVAEDAYEQKEKELQDEIDLIEKFLDDESLLMKQAIDDINGMNNTLYESMKNWAEETTGSVWEVVDAWKSAKEALEVYNSASNVGGLLNTLNDNSSNNMVTETKLGTTLSGGNSTSGNKTNASPSSNTVPEKGDKVIFESGNYYSSSYGTGTSGTLQSGKQVYITAVNPKGSHPYHISTGSKLGSGDLGWVTLKQLKGYASGTKKVPYDMIALVDELGDELKLHANGQGKLEYLTKGSGVVPANLTENLMKWGEISPASFKFNIPDYTKAFKGVGSNMVVNVGDININGDMGNLTVSDLNKFRKDLAYDVMNIMNKNRTKSGRY